MGESLKIYVYLYLIKYIYVYYLKYRLHEDMP